GRKAAGSEEAAAHHGNGRGGDQGDQADLAEALERRGEVVEEIAGLGGIEAAVGARHGEAAEPDGETRAADVERVKVGSAVAPPSGRGAPVDARIGVVDAADADDAIGIDEAEEQIAARAAVEFEADGLLRRDVIIAVLVEDREELVDLALEEAIDLAA